MNLKHKLDLLYETFDFRFLSPDPLELIHRFDNPQDQEVAGMVAALLAYGRVEQIIADVSKIFSIMEWRPYEFTMQFDPERDRSLFKGFVHRFNDYKDIVCLIFLIQQVIKKAGSIGAFFMDGYCAEDKNTGSALASFSRRMIQMSEKKGGVSGGRGFAFFFPSPEKGSPCKRLNLYLRWMVRRADALDFGLWRDLSPAKLVIPLDTHVARIAKNIGLTKRKNACWKMAEEITERLKRFDPCDPVKYDFSLCRLGILDYCPAKRNEANCGECMIKEICLV